MIVCFECDHRYDTEGPCPECGGSGETFDNPVAALIARHDLTQGAAASLLGVTPRAVAHYLAGARPVSTPATILCRALIHDEAKGWWGPRVADVRRRFPDRRRKQPIS
jgi:hypothetical protein